MKTGGTLNFLKRAGAILMLLAIFASSCNKYADDFAQINTKLDGLIGNTATTIGLTAAIADLTLKIKAVQDAVTALPNPTQSIATLTANLATANANILLMQTALTNLNIAVGKTATTLQLNQAVIDITANVKAELAKQLLLVTNAIAAAQLAIVTSNDLQTIALNKAIVDNNTTMANLLKIQIDNLSTKITDLDNARITADALVIATVNAIKLGIDNQKIILDQLLINTNMVNQDIYIASLTDMRYWLGKLSQIGIVNGNVTINTAALTTKMDSLNMITSRITAVIGSQYLVVGGVSVQSSNSVYINSTGTTSALPLDLSRLYSVVGSYVVAGSSSTVAGVDVSDGHLATVGSYLTANYAGVYDFPNLSSVGGVLTLVNVLNTATPAVSLITAINVPSATATGLNDGINATGTVSYPRALSINLGGGVPITTSLTAIIATNVTLGALSFGTVLIDVPACTTLSIAKAATVTALTINAAATCLPDLSSLKSGALTITGPTTLNLLGAYASGLLTSTTATTVVLPVHEWASAANIPAVVSLTLGKLANALTTAPYSLLTTLVVTGKAPSTTSPAYATSYAGASPLRATVTTSASNTVLASVALAGTLKSALIQDNVALVSLTTQGIINELTIDNDDALVSLATGALNHDHFVGGPGSDLIVTNNLKLTTLNSGALDYPRVIRIQTNAVLATLTLSSYVTPLLPIVGANTEITIGAADAVSNSLIGNYVKAIAITATTPYYETRITSVALNLLQLFVAKYPAPASGVYPTLTLKCNIDKVTLNSVAGNNTLDNRIGSDVDHNMVPGGAPFNFGSTSSTYGITTQEEFTLVQ